MKKTIIMLCAAVMLAGAIFADAPELKNIMPNSWEKLARLSEAEDTPNQMMEKAFEHFGWNHEAYVIIKGT